MRRTNDPEFDLSIQKSVAAPPAAVFDAWTDAQQMKSWWGLKEAFCPRVEIDLRVGGAYCIENELPDGRTVLITGIYQIITRPKRLVYTWSVNGGADELVDVTIEPDGTGSKVTIVHTMLPDSETHKGHMRGWRNSLAQLKTYVEYATFHLS